MLKPPWEVIERIIDYCWDHAPTLRSLSFTCRQLYPRSLSHLISSVNLQSRDRVFAFCDFLQTSAHFRPLVQAIVVSPAHFVASLLYALPNLSELKIYNSPPLPTFRADSCILDPHKSTLACCRRIGDHILTLHLINISLPNPLALAHLLATFAAVDDLVCEKLSVNLNIVSQPVEPLKRRLRGRLKPTKLTVSARP